VIVVDDGSSDRTIELIRKVKKTEPRVKLLRNSRNLGKGAAVKKGVLKACGRYILFTDVDLSAPIDQFDKFEKYLKQGFDVVIGSRRIDGSQIGIHQPWVRRVLGAIFYFLTRKFILSGIVDSNCGFKAYRRPAAQEIFKLQTINRWAFDVELLLIAQKKNFKIKEVPIKWYDSPYSQVKIGMAIFSSLRDVVKIKINEKRGLYG